MDGMHKPMILVMGNNKFRFLFKPRLASPKRCEGKGGTTH